jgi:hypothetical protein
MAGAGTGFAGSRAGPGSGGRPAAQTGSAGAWRRRALAGGCLAASAPPVLCASMGGMLRVLRLCSVFEPRELSPAWVAYDPIAGMQNHVAELTRCLDRLGVAQVVVTSRLAGAADSVRLRGAWPGDPDRAAGSGAAVGLGAAGCAARAGRRPGGSGPRALRGGSGRAAAGLARGAPPRLPAGGHRAPERAACARPVTRRGVLLRAAGGAVERWLLPAALAGRLLAACHAPAAPLAVPSLAGSAA